ncbi:uncharacterized protein LOC6579009 isoform X1 [Drosophila mojavensis]|uniref:uncharacterized protein LOC6579009 isoform X1 n=1 Tax=Drosophila mojavensis TaxID=7230 RepID=UPI001CD0EFDD|nr:uncharacterized protein LOC6579009 isoform X1 [Drosophila mojavensis]XP_032585867.2 uncharacterized protein LOC6579009 isoform X1 [Drosophila mojavensis]
MSSGSSNIDPNEFNEINGANAGNSEREHHNAAEEMPDPDMLHPDMPRATSRSSHSRGASGQSRRIRQRMLTPGIGNQYRIWVYHPMHEPHPNRHTLNRIIFSIARALRTRRSVPPQPGQRPGVIYRRNADLITIDVERDFSSYGRS